jgi:Flp pilus assembly protein TadB
MWWVLVWSLVGLAAAVVLLAQRRAAPTRSIGWVSRRGLAGAATLRRIGGSAAVGSAALVVSRWPLPSLVAAVVVWWVWGVWESSRRTAHCETALLDALAVWIENLRDVLAAGEQPIGAISQTATSCSVELAPAVRRLAAGLHRQDPESALRRFAADLDDPLADLVATGLMVAIRRGGRAIDVLSMLASQARHSVDRRRLIEAERAPVTREVWLLTALMSVLFAAVFVFGNSGYLSMYRSPSGQMLLSLALVGYALLIARVQRLARFPRARRILIATSEPIGRGTVQRALPGDDRRRW